MVTTDVAESNKAGFGKNKRTAEFLGGGSALGALMGGIFGGGKGAGIGALTRGGWRICDAGVYAGERSESTSGEFVALPVG